MGKVLGQDNVNETVTHMGCCCLVAKSCLTLLWPHGQEPARLLHPWDFPGKNTEMGCHFLLQRIFLTQRLKLSLWHWFPWWLSGKESACLSGDSDSIPRLKKGLSSLEKEMATHSSILTWNIPWTEEPGGLQSMGSQRVGHDLATNQPTTAIIHMG